MTQPIWASVDQLSYTLPRMVDDPTYFGPSLITHPTLYLEGQQPYLFV
jgi:hypothetical protein